MARTGLNEEEVLLLLMDAWASDYLLPDEPPAALDWIARHYQ